MFLDTDSRPLMSVSRASTRNTDCSVRYSQMNELQSLMDAAKILDTAKQDTTDLPIEIWRKVLHARDYIGKQITGYFEAAV